jgi:transposase-like protein
MEESFNSPVDIDVEFIKQNQKLYSEKISKKGGPYTKTQRDQRRQEVYRLHFEYGYSAKKIAELMKVNRNTVNGDVDYWYSKISKNTNIFNPESVIIVNLERLDIQRSRLREQLDKVESFQEKLALERLMYDIDCKILCIYNRLAESSKRIMDLSTDSLNKWMKDNKREERYMKLLDKITVSEKALEKINKIIKEDKLRGRPN